MVGNLCRRMLLALTYYTDVMHVVERRVVDK